jgi:DNA-binding response OmpR family regulator
MTTIAGAAIKDEILVVDDERDITSVIKKGLKSNGF